MKVYRIYDTGTYFVYVDNDDKPISELTELLRKFFNNFWLGLDELDTFDIPNLYAVIEIP